MSRRLLHFRVSLIFILSLNPFLCLLSICAAPVLFSLTFKPFSILSTIHMSVIFPELCLETKAACKRFSGAGRGGAVSLFSMSVIFHLWDPDRTCLPEWACSFPPLCGLTNHLFTGDSPFPQIFPGTPANQTHTKLSFVLPFTSYPALPYHSVSNFLLFTRQCLVPWECWYACRSVPIHCRASFLPQRITSIWLGILNDWLTFRQTSGLSPGWRWA